jgi:hypothetical protein
MTSFSSLVRASADLFVTVLLILACSCTTTEQRGDTGGAQMATLRPDVPQDPKPAPAPAPGAERNSDEEMAMKLANPIANLISAPIQYNYDHDFGVADDVHRSLLNVQPVVPFELNADWNLISRTILPVTWTDDVPSGTGNEFGIGDVEQSAFFSPKALTAGGATWGVGPVLLLPTATESTLGGEKWGAGPTGVILWQDGPWTYGGLGNHLWSFAGDDNRSDVNATFLQPFLAYATKSAMTFSFNSESTYDWISSDWLIAMNAVVSQLVTIGEQKVNLSVGVRHWAESPDVGPEGLGLRLACTLLF